MIVVESHSSVPSDSGPPSVGMVEAVASTASTGAPLLVAVTALVLLMAPALPGAGRRGGRRRPLADRKRHGRQDVRQVGQGLREVAAHLAGPRVVLLGEQAQVVAGLQRALEALARLLVPALRGQHLDEPERAG